MVIFPLKEANRSSLAGPLKTAGHWMPYLKVSFPIRPTPLMA
jgi:hypothetical protein